MTQGEVRNQLIGQLIAAGVDRSAAGQQVDIALHAVETSLAALMRVVDALQGADWLNAQALAFQLMSKRCIVAFGALQQATQKHTTGQLVQMAIGPTQ